MKYVKFFKESGKEDVELVGGKGANLGELYNFRLNVPDGFVITTKAFSKALTPELKTKIKRKLESIDLRNYSKLKVISEDLKSLFLKNIPPEIKTEISKAYQRLGEPLVAVRSSATCEDLEKTSFAGQFTTFLNVGSKEELFERVKECWASLFNPRAIIYRDSCEIPQVGSKMAVVVQKMIDAEKAGVVFSRAPQNKSKILIEAAFGLGETIVSGSTTPDRYEVNRKDRKITKRKINKQIIYHTREDSKTVEKNLPKKKQEKQVLTDQEILKVADLALKVEKYYESSQDIEWCIKGENLFVLQSRPITGK